MFIYVQLLSCSSKSAPHMLPTCTGDDTHLQDNQGSMIQGLFQGVQAGADSFQEFFFSQHTGQIHDARPLV